MPDLPEALTEQLRPAFPRLRLLLRVIAEDPRESLSIDDILIALYLRHPEVQKRTTVTQQLHSAVRTGMLCRAARGRYSMTLDGRLMLDKLS